MMITWLWVRCTGQAERRRVLEHLGVGADRDAGLGAEPGQDLAQPPALRDRHRDLHQVFRVDQQRVGQRRLHMLAHPVEAGQQAGRIRAVLGRQDERAGAGYHAELGQLRPEAGRRVTGGDLDHHGAGAVPRVVGRVVLAHVEAVGVGAAYGQRDDDDQQRGQRRDPAEPAPRTAATRPASATATVRALAGVRSATAAVGPGVVVSFAIGVVAETGDEPAAALIPVLWVRLAVPVPRVGLRLVELAGAGLRGLAGVPAGGPSGSPGFRAAKPLAPAPGRLLRVSGSALIRRPGGPRIVVPGLVVHRLVSGRQRPNAVTRPPVVSAGKPVRPLGPLGSLRPSAAVLAHAPAPGTSWPGGRPVARSTSRAACSRTAAAAASTIWRRARESFPPRRSASCASVVVNRSSTSRTGMGASRPARSAANSRAPAAAAPSWPDSDVGSPTMTSIAPSPTASLASSARASSAFAPGPDGSTVSGVASTPPGSLRATPTRTEPTSAASRTPCLNRSWLTGTAPGQAQAGRDPETKTPEGRRSMSIRYLPDPTLSRDVPQSLT